MWHEMYKLGRDGHLPKARMQREKRGGQWLFGEWIPDSANRPVAHAAPIVAVSVYEVKNEKTFILKDCGDFGKSFGTKHLNSNWYNLGYFIIS